MTEIHERQKKPSPQARWAARNPLATWAHSATRSAIRRGLLNVPKHCERCGATGRIEAHHADHRDPLSVEFWCAGCHRRHHARERKEQRGPRR
jgi:hypothetical protein